MALVVDGVCFVVMGPKNWNEVSSLNYLDDMGAPKTIHSEFKRIYRWNIPQFVYSFDASFVNYFGFEGMEAVHEAIDVMNDFFVNDHYQGVSQLDLARHGFAGNYNTTWINTTAQNEQIIDLKSLTLGMMVNHLGLGNPHRHAFTIAEATNSVGTAVNFNVWLRNYDPVTLNKTNVINGVNYSYRLATDANFIADMVEFTTESSGNEWTAVAGITAAFYGNTALFWDDTPTVFNFGVYYDSSNALGGQHQPRHALTYDDAGGLKYLYSTNNYMFEDIGSYVYCVSMAPFLPEPLHNLYPPKRGNNYWPRQGPTGVWPIASNTNPFRGNRGIPEWSGLPLLAPVATAVRGGVDQIQFHHRSYDSLLGRHFTPTNFVWDDTFLYQNFTNDVVGLSRNGIKIGEINTKSRGIQWNRGVDDLSGTKFFDVPERGRRWITQRVGRSVQAPDIMFTADTLTNSPDGVPIGFTRTTPVMNFTNSAVFGMNADITNQVGPGIFLLPGSGTAPSFTFTFHKTSQNFEVLWSGESSVVGNIEGQPSLWGYIKGPGPRDYMTFPQSGTMSWVQNSILPLTKVPEISLVSDNGGTQPIEKNTLTRTLETLSITGEGMGSAKAIEIMNGDLVIQRIMPVGQYIVSAQQIDLPPGIISLEAEGGARQIRVWNELGASISSEQKFNIETGKPVITSTSADRIIHDRAQHLELTGYGFKSMRVGETRLTHIRVDNEAGDAVYDNGIAGGGVSDGLPLQVAQLEVVSDTRATLPQDSIGSAADGANRRLRVSRRTVASAQDVGGVLSPPTNPLFTAITAKPVVTSLQQLNSTETWEDVLVTGMFKRDRALEINGTGLNTLTTIEIVRGDGSSFANPVFIQLPNAGVNVEDNGTRILMAADVIPWPDADTNSTAKRMFKLYNGVANTDLNASQSFTVNIQPKAEAIGGFTQPGYFNRDRTLGDDLLIYGSGLQAVSQIIFTDANDTSQARFTLSLPVPGITVTDNLISVDTQVYQLGGGADTEVNSARRILKLTSARDEVLSSMNQRFYVGTPPAITSVGGIGGDGNYSRDLETLSVTGTSFGHVSKLEIVDINGNPITGALGLGDNTGLNLLSGTSLSVDANATGWVNMAHLLDTVNANGRRVRVSTPFGVVTSAEGFTVSAKPGLPATVQATFAGGGYDGGTNIYDQSEGDLYINGSNFGGVKQVVFYVGGVSQGSITMDPKNPPLGVIVNGEGTRIFMDDSILPAGWIGSNTATIGLINVAGSENNSTSIQTQQ